MESLTTRDVDLQEFGPQFDKATREYFAVKTRDLFAGAVLPFDILFPSLDRVRRDVFMKVLLSEGQEYEKSFHDRLMEGEVEDIYIEKDKESIYFERAISKMKSSTSLEN